MLAESVARISYASGTVTLSLEWWTAGKAVRHVARQTQIPRHLATMKKSKELIEALLAESRASAVTALIVRLPSGDEYVFSTTKPSPLTVLDKMMEGGGRVLAIAAVKRGTLNHVTAYARALDDFVSNPVLLNTLALRFQRYIEFHGVAAANCWPVGDPLLKARAGQPSCR